MPYVRSAWLANLHASHRPAEVKITRILFLVLAGGLIVACEPGRQSDQPEICVQAAGFIERNSVELQEPRDWNRLMTAASRLVYSENDCGGLVAESAELLCASLGKALAAFESSPHVPKGPNRDNALSVANQTYKQADCAGIYTAR